MDDFDGLRTVTRRQVLKGGAAVAALGGVSAFLAACSSTGATAAPARRRPRQRAGIAARRRPHPRSAEAPSTAVSGSVTLGSNYSDADPEGRAGRRSSTRSRQHDRHHGQDQHDRPRHVPGPDQLVPPGHAGRRVHLVLRLPDAVLRRAGPRDRHQRRLGQGRGQLLGRVQGRAPPANDGKQYFIPIYNYPWAVFYRKSVFADKGYTIPTTLDEFKALADEDADRRPDPDGLRRQRRLAGDGHVRHHQPAPERLRLPRRADGRRRRSGPIRRSRRSSRPGRRSSRSTRRAPPAGPGRTPRRRWSRRRPACTCSGCSCPSSSRRPATADLADLDFFPYPNFGTEFDAEKALDAPIDGFMISANSPTLAADLDASKAFMEYLAQPATQVTWVSQDKGNIAAAKDADTSGYTDLQKKAGGADRRRPADHPVPRPRHEPELRRPERHAGLPARLPQEPQPGSGRLPREDPELLGHPVAPSARSG